MGRHPSGPTPRVEESIATQISQANP
jgi:hypothetical protein